MLELMRPVRSLSMLLVLALSAACGHAPPRPAPTAPPAPPAAPPVSRAEAALEASCRSFQADYEWKRSAAPAAAVRMLYSVPAGAPAQLWFSGRNRAVALCTPCVRGGAAVHSFEWYEPGFRKGELKLQKCAAQSR
jgi:hypothetical protein